MIHTEYVSLNFRLFRLPFMHLRGIRIFIYPITVSFLKHTHSTSRVCARTQSVCMDAFLLLFSSYLATQKHPFFNWGFRSSTLGGVEKWWHDKNVSNRSGFRVFKLTLCFTIGEFTKGSAFYFSDNSNGNNCFRTCLVAILADDGWSQYPQHWSAVWHGKGTWWSCKTCWAPSSREHLKQRPGL